MKSITYSIFVLVALLVSCEDYLEIDPPKNQLAGENIFTESTTVDGVFAHIYAQFRDQAFTKGSTTGLSYLFGHYADELDHLSEGQPLTRSYYNNGVLATEGTGDLWNVSYNIIYDCNRILEGVNGSKSLDSALKDRFLGEAYFVRAFVHFYITNFFGEIPYITTTDYRVNQKVVRDDVESVYQHLEEDLLLATELLSETSGDGTNFRPNRWTAAALLSRVYLYQDKWQLALNEAELVIGNSGYGLEPNLDLVFLKDSPETLWQLDTGMEGENTDEAGTFVPVSAPPSNTALNTALLEAFEPGDARREQWVGSITDGSQTWYFPYKYKERMATDQTQECPILLRLVEAYLIAAEASAQLGNLEDGLDYLNAIRERATLDELGSMGREELLEAILQERRIELFSELGHRYFDLKRTGRADAVLGLLKPFWDPTDILLPLPEDELLKNPKLLPQNEGY
ncbi:RagB/SusD family nutrient uptake outer membrane protein [Flagellimonas iocasae]|uniref:RagB/SusD family nutrient uptake outer membrane protein n=1 Tax=Flagellimonas iocasae TaxID=2055905 RepID=A0ABW4Y3S5_9FLAO